MSYKPTSKKQKRRLLAIILTGVFLLILSVNAFSESSYVMMVFWLILLIPAEALVLYAFKHFYKDREKMAGVIVMLIMGITLLGRIMSLLTG